MNVAIIPARGGSKRIPRKNIKPFGGRPIIYYSIRAAIDSGLFDHIIVSTEDEEIARIASGFGASVPFKRPAHLADDHVSSSLVMKHALGWCDANGIKCDYACCIYPIAPMLSPVYLRNGFDRLKAGDVSYVFPVTTFACPIQRALRRVADGTVLPFFPEQILNRSQEFEMACHDASQFYWGTVKAFMRDSSVYSIPGAAAVMEIPRYLVQDIDTPEDWEMAEHLWSRFTSA